MVWLVKLNQIWMRYAWATWSLWNTLNKRIVQLLNPTRFDRKSSNLNYSNCSSYFIIFSSFYWLLGFFSFLFFLHIHTYVCDVYDEMVYHCSFEHNRTFHLALPIFVIENFNLENCIEQLEELLPYTVNWMANQCMREIELVCKICVYVSLKRIYKKSEGCIADLCVEVIRFFSLSLSYFPYVYALNRTEIINGFAPYHTFGDSLILFKFFVNTITHS